MFERFRKKSSAKKETSEGVGATAELKAGEESKSASRGNEIEQARQDLMRAAMEAVMMPDAEAEPGAAASVPPKSDEAEIPVIQVKVTRPTPPAPKSESKPPTPSPTTESTVKREPVSPPEPKESRPVPAEPALVEPKAPDSEEAEEVEVATEEVLEIVPLRTEPLVVEHKPTETKDTAGPEIQSIAEPKDIPAEKDLDTPADSVVGEAFPVELELPRQASSEELRIEEPEDISEEDIFAHISLENEHLLSRLMVSADVETMEASGENAPVEKIPESRAFKTPTTAVSLSVPTGKPSEEPRIAHLDDIMIDIVKQDIASHRRRISGQR